MASRLEDGYDSANIRLHETTPEKPKSIKLRKMLVSYTTFSTSEISSKYHLQLAFHRATANAQSYYVLVVCNQQVVDLGSLIASGWTAVAELDCNHHNIDENNRGNTNPRFLD
ncbi:hypothetical protein ACMFMG_002163 [Clarireedia jacksonii]